MTHNLIERNRGFLKGMSGLLRGVSQILLVLGVMWAGLKFIALATRLGDWTALKEQWANTPSGIFLFLLLGVVGLGTAQLLRYMLDPEYWPGWLLRHGDKLLYLCAGGILLQAAGDSLVILSRQSTWGWGLLAILFELLFALSASVILAGLAQVLKRLLPLIDEARTLA